MPRTLGKFAVLFGALLVAPSFSFAQAPAFTVLDSATISESGARTLAELLAARVPGVDVTWLSGAPGFAAHVTVRGAVGGTGSGRPDLYVDGVLLRDDQQWMHERPDNLRPAHHWDIPVEELHEVRVVLGASAGAFLELGASRGAVLVTTVRPRNGAWRSRVTAKSLWIAGSPEVPSVTTRLGTLSGGGVTNLCTLRLEASGGCIPTGTTTLRPFGGQSAFDPSVGGRLALAAVGGLWGGQARIGLVGDANPGSLGERINRGDVAFAFQRSFDRGVAFSTDVRGSSVDGDYAQYALLRQVGSVVRLGTDSGLGVPGLPLSQIRQIGQQDHRIRRLHGGIASEIRIGRAGRLNLALRGEGYSRSIAFDGPGSVDHARRSGTFSVDYSAQRRLRAGLEVDWRIAAWHQRLSLDETSPAASYTTELEMTTAVIGTKVVSNDRRSLDLGLRTELPNETDDWPAAQSPLPFASASWRISDEVWMPNLPLFPEWRLGLAYGESTDQQAFQDAQFEFVGGASLGLSAERALEREMSFEATSESGALQLLGRLFERRVAGSHMNVPEAATVGLLQRLRPNIPIETSGGELALRMKKRHGETASSEITIWAARARSRFGALPFAGFLSRDGVSGLSSPIGSGERYGGVPLYDVIVTDTNGDGVITPDEAVVTGIAGVAAGTPTHTLGLSVSLRDASGWSAGFTVDAKTGHQREDIETLGRCIQRLCDQVYDPSTALRTQGQLARLIPATSDASFARLREIWLRRRLSSIGRGKVSFSLVGQHLLSVTTYSGRDPEATSFFRPGIVFGESFQEPLRPALLLRVDVGAQ